MKRFLSMFLAIVMVIGLIPVTTFAVEDDAESTTPETTEIVTEETTGETTEETTGETTEETTGETTEETTGETTEETTGETTEETTGETTGETVAMVEYTVNHSILDFETDIFELKESEKLTGIAGELTNAQAKDYENCILYEEIVQVEIAADGSTVVDVYYIELQEEATVYTETDLYDTSVSEEYFKVISADTYALAPGAEEHEIVLNNADGSDRKVVHIFEVDTNNEELEVMPGYYAIDQLNPDDLAGDSAIWSAAKLSDTVAYYENMGYNVVGAMNTALAYDSNAPYGYMVWNGVVLGTPEIHSGAQTYLAINWDGTCELRSMSTALTGNEKTAISANFGWLVKDGALVNTTVGRTDSDASRSMIGIKADGTLIFCQVDGRNGAVSSGLSSYEMGEMMLALGCVNAVNCDGGGSSTFISKRAGEDENTMRSVPSDGSERPTINSVILVSTAGATGVFAEALINAEYDYIAPGAHMAFDVTALDTKGFTMDVPVDVTYQVAEDGMGTIDNGVFTAGAATGTATIQAVYNGTVVGEMAVNIVNPESFGFSADSTVLPYGKSAELELVTAYGDDDWAVCIDGAYTLTLSDETAATLVGNILTAPTDESITGVDVTVVYLPDSAMTDIITVTYGKGSEIIFDFEDGDVSDWMGFDEAKQWSIDNGVNNTLVGSSPLAGQFSPQVDGYTSLADAENGQVKNGNYALAWTLDNTDADFAGWTYNVLFNVGEPIVLRDVANGLNATSLGMWLYIPEGATGLAFQSQLYVKNDDGSLSCKQAHFTFTTVDGTVKNLNSCTEADIPQSRWVYASIDLTQYDYIQTPDPTDESNSRSPSIIRTYVKPTAPAVHTFYIDDITLDYSSAVDDRVAPVIGEIQYASADTAVAAEGATITTNAASFTAEISDNAVLDTTTAQIYIDGNKVDTQISGKLMSTATDITMDNGAHVITFEIADSLGNYSQSSASFTVQYSEEESLVYVDGHNDSGALPEYDSVYYVDIKTSDIAQIECVEVNVKLNSANTWELEHAFVAEGFSFEYEILSADNSYAVMATSSDIHSTDNVAVVTITRTGDCTLSGEQTLISLPVRVWSWDEESSGITAEDQFATGYCPVVTIDYDVLYGCAETVDGEYVSFSGSGSVETMLNDNVNPWHYHDEELTVLAQEATCSAAGYTDRTYCESCQSVVDWGTKVPATGHTYEISNEQLVCGCGHTITGTGIVEANGKLYCLIADKLVTGWQAVGSDWCYADASTMEVQTGEFTVDGMTYTADESGIVIKGAWVTDENGTKYSYGPQFYTREWAEIDGAKYYFGTDSYMYTGIRFIVVNRNNIKEGYRVYKFAEDGKLEDEMLDANGIITSEVDGMFWVVNGTSVYGGLMLIDGDYYYARTSGQLVVGKEYWITKNNDLLPVGNYTFGDDGKMIDPPGVEQPDEGGDSGETEEPEVTVKNGIVSEDGVLYWYVDGVKTYGGLLYLDADNDGEADTYYYARSSGKLAVSCQYWITKTNDLLPEGYYNFDENGRMIDPPVVEQPDESEEGDDSDDSGDSGDSGETEEPEVTVKNGIVSEDGVLYWYVDDVKTYGGLLYLDTDNDGEADTYYYARSSGKLAVSCQYWITKNNDLLPVGYYNFDENGKMTDAPAVEQPDEGEDGSDSGDSGETEEPEVTVKNGVCADENGVLYYYVDDVKTYSGLLYLDTDGDGVADTYYYARTSGQIVVSAKYWISKTNDLLPAGYYNFDENGKMIDPPTA